MTLSSGDLARELPLDDTYIEVHETPTGEAGDKEQVDTLVELAKEVLHEHHDEYFGGSFGPVGRWIIISPFAPNSPSTATSPGTRPPSSAA